jgi:hypothetical protein
VLFRLLIPGLTPVSLLESKSGFEIVTQLAVTMKTIIFRSIVYGSNQDSSYPCSLRTFSTRPVATFQIKTEPSDDPAATRDESGLKAALLQSTLTWNPSALQH